MCLSLLLRCSVDEFQKARIGLITLGLMIYSLVAALSHAAADSSAPTSAATERIHVLRSEIQRHDQLYHRAANPEISDAEYDELKRELIALERRESTAATLVFNTDDRLPGFSSYEHGQRMLSLEKAHSEGDLSRFHHRVVKLLGKQPVYVVEPKFDGIAVSATYANGELVRVLTRGDGVTGDDVSANAIQRAAVPRKLVRNGDRPFPESVEIRGEVFMTLAEFRRINGEREMAAEATYASPRNLAAGTLKSLENDAYSARRLEVVFYGLGAIGPDDQVIPNQQRLLLQLKKWGLPTTEHVRVALTYESLTAIIRELELERRAWDFPTDGLVVKVDAREDQATLGGNEQGPLWAVAYKFAPQRQSTQLRAITLQVGRTGLITPVAELDPIRLGGASITRASLHNGEEIARRDLRVGDYVVVERGGEIIPAIVGVDLSRRSDQSTPYLFPTKCPSCDDPLSRRENQIAWRCVNRACPAQLKRRLTHYASPGCVGIRGLGSATVGKLVDSGKVKSVSDVYLLTREDLLAVDGINSVDALLSAILASKNADLWRVIYGIGIEGVGARAAKQLAAEIHNLRNLAEADLQRLQRIDGIGRSTAENVMAYFASTEARELLASLEHDEAVPSQVSAH